KWYGKLTYFFFQAEDGIRDFHVTGVQTCALPIYNTLEAQGHQPIKKHDPNRLPEFYDPAFINADADLGSIATGLIAAKSGRLCRSEERRVGKESSRQQNVRHKKNK